VSPWLLNTGRQSILYRETWRGRMRVVVSRRGQAPEPFATEADRLVVIAKGSRDYRKTSGTIAYRTEDRVGIAGRQ
jgi:hypothetical protein